MLVIIANGVAIGMETYTPSPFLMVCNNICLYIFTAELLLRFYARRSLGEYFSNGWNIFDLIIVVAGYIPEDLFSDSSMIALLRIMRVFRLIKIFRTNAEMRIIVTVMMRSMRTLLINIMMMMIFIYIFAVAGGYLFKLPTEASISPDMLPVLQQYIAQTQYDGVFRSDPYGTLDEAMFTLLRSVSGDAWTDIRYNLIFASNLGLIKASPMVISLFHIVWYVLGALLLINVLLGAILTNFENTMIREQEKLEQSGELQRGLLHKMLAIASEHAKKAVEAERAALHKSAENHAVQGPSDNSASTSETSKPAAATTEATSSAKASK